MFLQAWASQVDKRPGNSIITAGRWISLVVGVTTVAPSTSCQQHQSEPSEIAARFMSNLAKCDESVRSRLVVENEDKGIWTPKLLSEHFDLPITYDNLHHKCSTVFHTHRHSVFATSHGCAVATSSLCSITQSRIPTRPIPDHADMPSERPYETFSMPVDYDIELKSKDAAIEAFAYCSLTRTQDHA